MGATPQVADATLVRGRWVFNVRVPKALVSRFNRKIFQRALGTGDAREAKKRAAAMRVNFDKACELLEAGKTLKYALMASGFDEGNPFEMAQVAIDNMRPSARAALLDGVAPLPGRSEVDALIHELRLRRLTVGDAIRETSVIAKLPDPVDREIESYRIKRKVMDPYYSLTDRLGNIGLLAPPPKVASIHDMLLKWRNETQPKLMQIKVFEMSVRRFVDVVGDISVDKITAKHVAMYKDSIARLPTDTKRADMHGKSVQELIRIADRGNLKRVESTMVARHLSSIRTLLEIAKENGVTLENVADSIKIRRKKKNDEEESKRALTADELNKYMAAVAQEFDVKDDAYWFLPIGIYSGMRREEIGQLDILDVCVDNGIYYFNVNALNGKTVKNPTSKRLVPMHQRLIDLGFLNHIERSKEKGAGKIFKSLRKDGSGRCTSAMSKRQARVMREVAGLTDPDLAPCHSTRHTFISACRDAEMNELTMQAIVGQQGSNAVTAGYGRRAILETLNKAIQKVEHIGSDISNLIR